MVRCVVAASLAVEVERGGEAAARGREQAARPLLPANPLLAVSAGRSSGFGNEGPGTIWSASLSQEIEIAGQRGARRRVTGEERVGQQYRRQASERAAAAQALLLYFEALAADDELRLARRVERVATRVSDVAAGSTKQGLGSGVDADLAAATALRATQARLAAERRVRSARAALASAVGLDPATAEPKVTGRLDPVNGVLEYANAVLGGAGMDRPEIAAAEAERRAQTARAESYRRARVPNPSVSVFVERGVFNEQVLGAGIALPLPLPHPLGRTYAGEIAEAESLARRARSESARQRRQFRLELVTALRELESRKRELAAFDAPRMARAQQALEDIGAELEAGRLSVREALLVEQSLIELVRAEAVARFAVCRASVELGRTAGFPFERGGR